MPVGELGAHRLGLDAPDKRTAQKAKLGPAQRGLKDFDACGENGTFYPKLRLMVHTLTCNAFGEQTYRRGTWQMAGLTVVDPGMASGEEREGIS